MTLGPERRGISRGRSGCLAIFDLTLQKNGVEFMMSKRQGEHMRVYYMDTGALLKMTADTVSGHTILLKSLHVYL